MIGFMLSAINICEGRNVPTQNRKSAKPFRCVLFYFKLSPLVWVCQDLGFCCLILNIGQENSKLNYDNRDKLYNC